MYPGNFHKITPKNDKDEIFVIIEISKDGGPVKYEVDKDTGMLCVDRFMPVSMNYPCNYGFIPNTLGGDGDPLDVLVITDYPIIPGSLIKCKVLGCIEMLDESGSDEKVIAVPANKIDANYSEINAVNDLNKGILNRILHFFENYKKLEEGKWVKISSVKNRNDAIEIINSSISNYKK